MDQELTKKLTTLINDYSELRTFFDGQSKNLGGLNDYLASQLANSLLAEAMEAISSRNLEEDCQRQAHQLLIQCKALIDAGFSRNEAITLISDKPFNQPSDDDTLEKD